MKTAYRFGVTKWNALQHKESHQQKLAEQSNQCVVETWLFLHMWGNVCTSCHCFSLKEQVFLLVLHYCYITSVYNIHYMQADKLQIGPIYFACFHKEALSV